MLGWTLVEASTKDTLRTLENILSVDGLTWNWYLEIDHRVRLEDALRCHL